MAPWLAFEFIPLVVIFTFFRGLENTSPSANSDDVNQYFIFYCGRQEFKTAPDQLTDRGANTGWSASRFGCHAAMCTERRGAEVVAFGNR